MRQLSHIAQPTKFSPLLRQINWQTSETQEVHSSLTLFSLTWHLLVTLHFQAIYPTFLGRRIWIVRLQQGPLPHSNEWNPTLETALKAATSKSCAPESVIETWRLPESRIPWEQVKRQRLHLTQPRIRPDQVWGDTFSWGTSVLKAFIFRTTTGRSATLKLR